MSRLDAEQFIKLLETNMKANLNTEITQLNTDKGDSLLSTVSNSAYIVQTFKGKNLNYDPIVLLYVNDISLEDYTGGSAISTFEIYCILGFADQNDNNNGYRMLRYQKAIENYIFSNYRNIFRGVKVAIDSLNPLTLVLNSSQQINAVGVVLNITLTS